MGNQRNPTVHAIQLALKNPDIAAQFTRIAPDEITDKLMALAWEFQTPDKSEAVTVVVLENPRITPEIDIDEGLTVDRGIQQRASKMKLHVEDDTFNTLTPDYDPIDSAELEDLDKYA